MNSGYRLGGGLVVVLGGLVLGGWSGGGTSLESVSVLSERARARQGGERSFLSGAGKGRRRGWLARGRRKKGASRKRRKSDGPVSWRKVRRARRRSLGKVDRSFARSVRSYYSGGREFRLLIETDKPLYRPGETIWVRAVEVRLQRNALRQESAACLFKLVSPRGSVLKKKWVVMRYGQSAIQFKLGTGLRGGEYRLQVRNLQTGSRGKKKVVVSAYQAPRIKKKLDFVRKAYGAGERVEATLSLKRATGGVLARHPLRLVARLAGKVLRRWKEKTDRRGEALLSFRLPQKLRTDDGLLTVLVSLDGVTESISRPLPLMIRQIRLGFFPEGGQCVAGGPCRVYFAARRQKDGKPFDLEGEIRERGGAVVARVRSFHDGMGRFRFTPRKGRSYRLVVTKPRGVGRTFALPRAARGGVTLQLVDDFRSRRKQLRMLVYSDRPRRIVAVALQHETLMGQRAFALKKGRQVLSLPLRARWRGIVRLTLFGARYRRPLAERLVFRSRGRGLRIRIRANRRSYQPRDKVTLRVRVTTPAGKPVARARLGAAVVDDTVLSFADDDEPHFLAQRYLSGQLTGKIHKPNFYFERKKKKALRALDLVMGTHGWRAFSWKKVRQGKKPSPIARLYLKRICRPPSSTVRRNVYDVEEDAVEGDLVRPDGVKRARRARRRRRRVRRRRRRVRRVRRRRFYRRRVAQKRKVTERKREKRREFKPPPPSPVRDRPTRRPRASGRRPRKRGRPSPVKVAPQAAKTAARRPRKKKRKTGRKLSRYGKRGRAAKGGGAGRGKLRFRRPPRRRRGRRRILRFGAGQRRVGPRRVRRLVRVARRRIMIRQKVYFQRGKARIRRRSYALLNEVARILRRYPRLQVCLQGHTDSQEAKKGQQKRLSLRRARRVRRYLVRRGISLERLGVWGYGGKRPIVLNRTARERARNRRVEFRLASSRRRSRYKWSVMRRFPTKFYRKPRSFRGTRTDFRETVYWNPALVTNKKGRVSFSFGLNDNITSFRVRISGVGGGWLGRQEKVLSSKRPFFMVVKAPVEVSAGDRPLLPLTLRNDSSVPILLRVRALFTEELRLKEDPLPRSLRLAPGKAKTVLYPLEVQARRGRGQITFRAQSRGFSDSFRHTIEIRPRGFPREVSWAGKLSGKGERTFALNLPGDLRDAAPDTLLSLEPSPLGTMLKGMRSMLRQPHGCFEQASSANYPNVMVLQYIQASKIKSPRLVQRANKMLRRGYDKLVGYETKTRGYEWFGRQPGHEALSAYGLLQFADMRKVYPRVKRGVIDRTVKWLLARRDGKGGFDRSKRALDRFGRADSEITNAYITYALAEVGQKKKIETELTALETKGKKSKDPYLVALAASATVRRRGESHQSSRLLLERLASFQQKDGSFQGKKHSITRSTGRNLRIETTSLAVLALLKRKDQGVIQPVKRAVRWLRKQQSRHGGFGATQGTVLALRALTTYQRVARHPPAKGTLTVRVNGQTVARRSYDKKHRGAVTVKDFAHALRPGKNKVTLRLRSRVSVPFSFGLRYYTRHPLTTQGVSLGLKTKLSQKKARLGETVRLTALLRNRTNKPLPMVLARIAFPGALQSQTWQLKALREKGVVAFFETGAREVIFYLRGMAPRARKTIHLDLVARVPGRYTSAASRAYLYYTNDKKVWTRPLKLLVSH